MGDSLDSYFCKSFLTQNCTSGYATEKGNWHINGNSGICSWGKILFKFTNFHYKDFFLDPRWFLSYLAFWFFALFFTVPLLLTSSKWAMKKMGKYWKWLHRSVYLIIIFVVAHVVLLKSFLHLEYWPLIILILYFFFKILEWRGIRIPQKQNVRYPIWKKWICLPCGYIYDPIIGDEDSGIAPWTEFTDIPDNWRCPDCGVSKSDFVPFDETNPPVSFAAKIIEKKFLNPTTIELTIETEEEIPSFPGQYVSFYWNDSEGEFRRSYSIAKRSGKSFTFLIKLMKMGRGARILKEVSLNADIRIAWVFGSFRLQDTQNPKIFIATGTGLSPIYGMITSLNSQIKKKIYFSVALHEDLFYLDELESIQDLESFIHLTREKSEIHREGRIDIDSIMATPETEWYLCGNPGIITEAREKLQKRWFTHVYSEEF